MRTGRKLSARGADTPPRAMCADAALSEAASRAAVAFEAAPSAAVARGFGLPTTMRCVPPRSLGGRVLAARAIQTAAAPYKRRARRSSAFGTLPIWTNRRSPSGALSPLRCRRELTPIPPGQGLRRASAQSSGERQLQDAPHRLSPCREFASRGLLRARPNARLLMGGL